MVAQPYYYTDSTFQLELNLQDIRLELIEMIEEFEETECFTCNKLKCCCPDLSCSTLSELETDSRMSIKSQEEIEIKNIDTTDILKAPPAHTLPKPSEWEKEQESNGTSKSDHVQYKEIEDWVRASTPTAEAKVDKEFIAKEVDTTFTTASTTESVSDDLLNHSWPLPKSNLDKKIDLNTLTGQYQPVTNPVETFFRSFRQVQRPIFAGQLMRSPANKTAAAALLYNLKPKDKSYYAYF